MVLTNEQNKIINSKELSFKINAIAGSGKTTTLLEYAKKNSHLKILYLAYNKSLQIYIQNKLKKYQFLNIHVSTIHSLAYKNTQFFNYKLTNELNNYTIEELLAKYEFQKNHKNSIPSLEYCALIKNFISFYCNSSLIKIDKKLLEAYKKQNELSSKIFDILNKNEKKILEHIRIILSAMKNKKIYAIHDFYLKMFYLKKNTLSNLNYDLILVDEAQDISDVMLGIIENQNCRRIYVGDSFQQIYSFRFATNALNKIDLPLFELTKSFRFGNNYAKYLESNLNILYELNSSNLIKLNGMPFDTKIGEKFIDYSKQICIISRTTFGLISQIINYLNKNYKIYFEGGYDSYSFMNQTVYSIFYLKQKRNEKITVDEIKNFETISELEKFSKDTKNQDYLNIIKFVNTYGDNIFEINKKIKEHLVTNKEDANIIFTTTHKAKGLEYDQVIMANDFISKKDIISAKNKLSYQRINEELNIYYVASTRAKNIVVMADLNLDFKNEFNIKGY